MIVTGDYHKNIIKEQDGLKSCLGEKWEAGERKTLKIYTTERRAAGGEHSGEGRKSGHVR